ncbi:MAG: flagellar filament capping protein FliD [bacterium]
MAIYTSDVNRVTGLSGIDTDSMVDQLMQAESYLYENYLRTETYTGWQQEAYREVATLLQDFQDSWLGTSISNNIGYEAAWNSYINSVLDQYGNDSNVIKVTNSTSSGSFDIEVKQLATSESITGNSAINNKISTTTTASEIVQSVKDNEQLSIAFTVDGVTQNINITANELNAMDGTDAENLQSLLQDKLDSAFGNISGTTDSKVTAEIGSDGKLTFSPGTGVNASIGNGDPIEKDTSVTQSGVLNENLAGTYTLEIEIDGETYTVTADFEAYDSISETGDQNGDRLYLLSDAFASATDSNGNTVDLTEMISLDFQINDGTGTDLTISNDSYGETYTIKSASFTNITNLAGESQNNLSFTDETSTGTINSSNNLAALGLDTSVDTGGITTSSSLEDVFGSTFTNFLALNGDSDDCFNLEIGGATISIGADDTIDTMVAKINNADCGINLSFNTVTGRFKIDSSTEGAGGSINADSIDQDSLDFINNFLGIDLANKDNNASYTSGQNAIVVVDGVQVETSSNSLNMNGIEMELKGIGSVTVESEQDVDAVFEKIEEFVEAYNELVSTLEAYVNETRQKDASGSYYEPLLDEEKAVLSDSEIEKLEDAAKSGILYNDEYVSKILTELRSMIYEEVDLGGGLTISLYEIGITTTSDYNSGVLQIDEDKLRTAISERSSDISALFTSDGGVADQLQDIIDNQIGTDGALRTKAGIESTTSVTNNLLSDELSALAEKIAAEKERLYNKEMSYYSMFSAMESVINQQNAVMSMLLSSLG